MLIVTGTIQVPAEGIEATKAAATEVAIATRAEKGCRVYAFWHSIEQPGTFRVYEEWDDIDCLKAHGKAPHMTVWREKLKAIGVSGRDIKMFEPGPMTQL